MPSLFKLVLGTLIRGVPKPWDYIPIRAVMVNGYDLYQSGLFERAKNEGIRSILGVSEDVEIWFDSGGYQFLSRGISINVQEIAKIYSCINADYYISLDVPPPPKCSLEEKCRRIAKCIENFMKLKSLLPSLKDRIIPVYHFSYGQLLRNQVEAYEDIPLISVGGLIPFIMQRAGKYSRLKAVVFLALIRKLESGKVIHALGLASHIMIPLLKRLSINSSDTQTWRHKAAYGKIIIPGMGERHISSRKINFGRLYVQDEEYKLLVHYINVSGLNLKINDLRNSFIARALFNAWSLYYFSTNNVDSKIGYSSVFKKIHGLVHKLMKMSVAELEELLKAMESNKLASNFNLLESG